MNRYSHRTEEAHVVPRPIRDNNFGVTLFFVVVGLVMLGGLLLSIVH